MVRTESSGQHLRYLDGLRGIAILMVVMVHASFGIAGLPAPVANFTFYGVRGVQLFFVVSGLTLTLNHFGRPFLLGNFAARRFFRIAPMFYVGGCLYLLSGMTSGTPVEIASTILFVHGWLPDAINKVVPGGWSIAAEAMFYVLFPMILALARNQRRLRWCLLGCYIVAAASDFTLARLSNDRSFAMQFWLTQLPSFVGGCWLAGKGLHTTRAMAVSVLVLSALALLVDSELRGHSNLLIAIALLTIFVWSAGEVRPRFLEVGLLPYLGTISFSVYILHFAVVRCLRPFASGFSEALGSIPTLLLIYGFTVAITSVLASLSYHFVELPMIRLGKRVGTQKSHNLSGRSALPATDSELQPVATAEPPSSSALAEGCEC